MEKTTDDIHPTLFENILYIVVIMRNTMTLEAFSHYHRTVHMHLFVYRTQVNVGVASS